MKIPSNFTSSTNQLSFKFHSDDFETRSGFLISYETVPSYCSLTSCKEGEGDCNLDSQCEGLLVCGHMNCMNSSISDCCTQRCNNDSDCLNQECNDSYQCRLDSYSTDWSKCSQASPCADGEGDCDHHTDCEGVLVCGNDNCANGATGMDCCTDNGNEAITPLSIKSYCCTGKFKISKPQP